MNFWLEFGFAILGVAAVLHGGLRALAWYLERGAPTLDESIPVDYVDAQPTPDPDLCPLCGKFMAATDEIYCDGLRFVHSRCAVNPPKGAA